MIVIPIITAGAMIDLIQKRIPNSLLVVGFVAGIFTAFGFEGLSGIWNSLAGFMVGTVIMLPFDNWNLMGGADIKLAGVIGVMVGFPNVIIALVIGLVIGAIIIPVLQSMGAVKRGDRIPFGPMLTLGAISAYFGADKLMAIYPDIL